MTIPGRVEARVVVPTGGAAVSASEGAGSSAVTCTVPAAPYYLTAAGGVSSLLTVLQTQLNENRQGYPDTAAAMQAAVGYGTWSAGWLLNIASGNDTGAFGGVTLTGTSLTYGTPGPRGGIDKAIGFDASTDQADGGANFDVTTNDLVVASVVRFTGTPAVDKAIISKVAAAFASGWAIATNSTDLFLSAKVAAGAQITSSFAFSNIVANEWYALLAYIDRAGNTLRIGVQRLSTGTQTLGNSATPAANNFTTAATFRVGSSTWVGVDTQLSVAALYVGTGSAVASGLSANFSAALTNFANAVNSSFTVALGSDGRVTISNSFWPSSVAFTNTTLRDVLGFEYDVNYPTTPAQVTAALGGLCNFAGGAGYLCNESSGNIASVFGTPATATAAGSPTYSNPGPRGGSDKAIGLDSNTDSFSLGDVYDVSGTDDLAFVWVAYHSATPAGTFFNKFDGGSTLGYLLTCSAGTVIFQTYTGSINVNINVAVPNNTWYVGIVTIDRATAKARLGICPLNGSPTITSEATANTNTTANAAALSIGASAWLTGMTTDIRIGAFYIVAGAGVASGLSANLSAALSNFATYMKSQTGTQQTRGLWIPDCFLDIEGDPKRAPVDSDARSSISPTGNVITLVGNTLRRHRSLLWSHVPPERTWDAEATYENASWEEFFIETQLGLGSSWFTPGSLIQIYDHNNVQVGVDANVAGWSIIGLKSVELQKSVDGWTGFWRIQIPQIVAVGS